MSQITKSKTKKPIVAAAGLVVTLLLGAGCESGLAKYMHEPAPVTAEGDLSPMSVADATPRHELPADDVAGGDDMHLSEADILAARVSAYTAQIDSAPTEESPDRLATAAQPPAPDSQAPEPQSPELPAAEPAARPSAVEWTNPGTPGPMEPADAKFAEPGKKFPAKPAKPAKSGKPTESARPAAANASNVEMKLTGDLPDITAGIADPSAEQPATIDALQAEIDARIESDPRDVEAHLERQVINWLRHEPAPDPSAIGDLPVADRELISAVIDGLSNLRIALEPGENARRQDRVAPVLEMADRLRDAGSLTMGDLILCHNITGFGLYEPMKPAFPAKIPKGWSGQSLLYVEVDGFASQLAEDGQWETRLTEQCTLYSNTGLQVWAGPENEVIDRSRNKRRDFHISKVLRLPEDLPPGVYTLKLTLTDQTSNRLTEQTNTIRITRPEKQVVPG